MPTAIIRMRARPSDLEEFLDKVGFSKIREEKWEQGSITLNEHNLSNSSSAYLLRFCYSEVYPKDVKKFEEIKKSLIEKYSATIVS